MAGTAASGGAGVAREAAQEDASERLRAAIGRLSRRLRPTVAGSGLTPSQISVLFTVVRLGPVGLSELAELESLNATMLSRITANLCEAGLIVRTPAPGDRRQALVAATAAGRRMRRRIQRERARALEERVQELDEREREALWRALPALERLAELLPGGSPEPTAPARAGSARERLAARR
ncbi:MAG TPA: MarR family transcriptional regulator [Solirubrobacteraceae bacterium]|nr:MarR family transcriptional regulator [Solirubrobacteraceae bacterium]